MGAGQTSHGAAMPKCTSHSACASWEPFFLAGVMLRVFSANLRNRAGRCWRRGHASLSLAQRRPVRAHLENTDAGTGTGVPDAVLPVVTEVIGVHRLCADLSDPDHKRHEELREWMGDDFDPEALQGWESPAEGLKSGNLSTQSHLARHHPADLAPPVWCPRT